jgi:Flp pilus assembly protein TadD
MTTSLNRDDQRQLSAALGYFELEMTGDALEALDAISLAAADTRNVLALRLMVLQQAKNWPKAQITAARLVTTEPADPGWSIALAYATRRAECVERAQAILRDATLVHPGNALIHFNLACYACQLAQLDDAREHLRKAFALNAKLRSQALEDVDLQVLWPEIREQKTRAK